MGRRRATEAFGTTGGRGRYHPPRDEILKLGLGGQSGLWKGVACLTLLSRELLGGDIYGACTNVFKKVNLS